MTEFREKADVCVIGADARRHLPVRGLVCRQLFLQLI